MKGDSKTMWSKKNKGLISWYVTKYISAILLGNLLAGKVMTRTGKRHD